MKRNTIIVGASSGIGLELARVLVANGYCVGLVARRMNWLSELTLEFPTRAFAKAIKLRASFIAQQDAPADALSRATELCVGRPT